MSDKAQATLPDLTGRTEASPSGKAWPSALAWLALFFALAFWLKGIFTQDIHHPYLKADTEAGVSVTMLNYGTADKGRCEKQVADMARAMQSACPVCKITTQACKTVLNEAEYEWLSDQPLSTPTARSAEGVMLYHASSPDFALATCRMSESAGYGIRCQSAGTPRPYPADQKARIDTAKKNFNALITVSITLATGIIALLVAGAVLPKRKWLAGGWIDRSMLVAFDVLVMLTVYAIVGFPDFDEPLLLRQFDNKNLFTHAVLVLITLSIFWLVLEHYSRRRSAREESREIIQTLCLQLLVAGTAVFYVGLESARMATLITWLSLFIALPLGRLAARQLLAALGIGNTPLFAPEPHNARRVTLSSPSPGAPTQSPRSDINGGSLTTRVFALADMYFFPKAGSLIAAALMGALVLFATLERAPLPPPRSFLSADLNLTIAVLSGLCAGLMSWFVGWLILQSSHLHGHLSHDLADSGPQKVHTEPTPRIGGLAVASGLIASAVIAVIGEAKLSPHFALETTGYVLVLVTSLPAFLGGISEDLTKRVGPLDRLMLTIAAGAFAAWLLGAVITRLDIPWLDAALVSSPLIATLLTAIAVAGIANAINIIDGFNGLSAGYAVIVLVALACASLLAQDNLVLQLSLALAGALIGFLIWNWPHGKIFLGDGGAYLMGFLLAEMAVLLVMRNEEVSPWFPLVLMIYPVCETLYSVYRRKRLHKTKPGEPDRDHLHHLIHNHIVRVQATSPESGDNRTNAMVARFFWLANIIVAGSALFAWQSTATLMTLTALYVLLYIVTYRMFSRA